MIELPWNANKLLFSVLDSVLDNVPGEYKVLYTTSEL